MPAARSVLLVLCALLSAAGQTLSNGIRLPSPWPPRDVPLSLEPPPAPPYLAEPPAVIPIDLGRQLFVDDFLVEETTLRRVFHQAAYYPRNPVMQPDRPWEEGRAMPFSDGVFHDPRERLFKIWYFSAGATLYATSRDGVRWQKPELDVKPGTNTVHSGRRDSATVWLDLEERDPARRYKFLYSGGHGRTLALHYSPDGIHWGEPVASSIPADDRTTFFWNPFRKMWVLSLRSHQWTPEQQGDDTAVIGRMRRYWEAPDLAQAVRFRKEDPVVWTMADRLDPRRIDLNVQPQLYNLDAVGYESIMLGLFSIWRGQFPDREKPNEIAAGFSRDGFHWQRPSRAAFIPVSERYGDWNYGNVQSAGGVCLVVGDRLYFYVSGRAGKEGVRASGVMSTGLATLRRDGFASMEAGAAGGVLTTRPVRFTGSHLFVNVDSVEGDLRVEALDAAGRVVARSLPIRVDNTLQAVAWKSGGLAALAGKPARFRFHLRHARLYSFWVSAGPEGASGGYVGAGGPGFTGPTDTEGARAYRNCCKPAVW